MNNKLLKNLFFSYGTVFFSSCIGLVTVPLSLNYFGKEQFGLFAITADTISYLGLFNFGIPWAAATIFARLNDFRKQEELIKKSLIILLLLCLIVSLLIIIVGMFIPNWIHFIANLSYHEQSVARLFITISIIFFVVRLPFSLFGQLLIFINRVYIAKIFDLISSVMSLLCLIFVINLKLTIVAYAIINGVVLLLPLCLSVLIFVRIWKNQTYIIDNNDNVGIQYKDILSSSFYFFLNGIGGLILWNTDSLIVSHYLGLADTAEYALMFKFFLIVFMIITQLMNVINPLYPRYLKVNDFVVLKNLYSSTTCLFPIIGGLLFIFIYGFFKDFVILWTHNPSMYIGSLSCFAMGLYCYFLCSSIVPYSAIVSLNFSKQIYKLTLLEALLNLFTSIYLVGIFGVAGVIFGSLLAHVFTMFILVPKKLDILIPNVFIFNYGYIFKHIVLAVVPAIVILHLLNDRNLDILKILYFMLICIFYGLISYSIMGKKRFYDIIYTIRLIK